MYKFLLYISQKVKPHLMKLETEGHKLCLDTFSEFTKAGKNSYDRSTLLYHRTSDVWVCLRKHVSCPSVSSFDK